MARAAAASVGGNVSFFFLVFDRFKAFTNSVNGRLTGSQPALQQCSGA